MEPRSLFWGFAGKPRRQGKPESTVQPPDHKYNSVQPQLYLIGNSP